MAISPAKKIEIINKHAKNYTTKPNGSTPVLEGVHYSADGSVVATDRHTLIRIGHAHGFTQEFTAHAKTGATVDGQYPDISRIIPMEFKTQVALNYSGVVEAMGRVKAALEIAKATGDKMNLAKIIVGDGAATLSISADNPQLTYRADFSGGISGESASLTLNAQFLYNALAVLKDAGSKSVIIGISGRLSPVVLRDEENEIDIVVLPFRVAKEAA